MHVDGPAYTSGIPLMLLMTGMEMSRMQEAMGFRMGAIQESSRRKKLPLAKRIGRTDPCLPALFYSTRLTSCVITQATS